MLDRVRYWLRAIVRRSAVEREMREEMQMHLDRQTELLIARGMSAEDARLAARREFGNVAVHQEDGRDARHTRWIESIAADVRFSFRFFARKPLSSITIVLVLAFGIAGYAALFGLLQSAIMRPPPGLPDNSPLVLVRGMVREKSQPRWTPMRFSYSTLHEMSELRSVFSAVAGWTESDVVVDAPGSIDHAVARVQFVTDGYFSIIGVRPSRGTGLPASAPGALAESQLGVVISDAMWKDAFDGKDVKDRRVTVNGVAVRIVGIAPPMFDGAIGGSADDDRRSRIWMPLATRATLLAAVGRPTSSAALTSPDSTLFQAVGVLAPGVSAEQATAAARVILNAAVAQMTPPPATSPNGAIPPMLVRDADVVPLQGWSGALKLAVGMPDESSIAPVFIAAGVVITLVLLVVCTNVAGLVISSAVARRQEIAVRLSLGASRARVIRQLLTENIVLAAFGGALSLVVYWGVIVALSRFPEAAMMGPDLGTVAFTMVVALGTGILCGLAPALHATRGGVATALKDTSMGATRRARLQHAFVVAQVMLTQPLLVIIAGFIASSLLMTKKPLPNGVSDYVLQLGIDARFVPGTTTQKQAAIDRAIRRISEIPGVASILPNTVIIRDEMLKIRPEDAGPLMRSGDVVVARMQLVTPGYFSLLGMPLLRGSDVTTSSDTNATMIIGSDMARRLWGDADPIGRRFTQVLPTDMRKREIVVGGVYDSRYFYKDPNIVFHLASVLSFGDYLIRTTVPASELADPIRRMVRDELPLAPIKGLVTLTQREAESSATERNIRAGSAAAGALVLFLSAIGLYGAVALGVGQRRREIGIRMALGARASQVVALFYRGGVRLGIIGLVLGLPISLVASRLLNTLENVDGAVDKHASVVVVGALIAGIVLVVASVATLIPATRAARVNPVTTLNSD